MLKSYNKNSKDEEVDDFKRTLINHLVKKITETKIKFGLKKMLDNFSINHIKTSSDLQE